MPFSIRNSGESGRVWGNGNVLENSGEGEMVLEGMS